MKKTRISLRGIQEILSEKELKNVLGGSEYKKACTWDDGACDKITMCISGDIEGYCKLDSDNNCTCQKD